jgi:hypothetical protein
MNIPMSATSTAAVRFYPLQTVRCIGPAAFRSQAARDYACLLDVDDDVVEWSCLVQLEYRGHVRDADFIVKRTSSDTVVDILTAESDIPWTKVPTGFRHEIVDPQEFPKVRLQNAKDLVRYAGNRVTLSDRVRLLAALDDQGSLSVAECLCVFRDTQPIAGIAKLLLQRFIEVDLDVAPIGPETQVRRKR